MPPRVYLPPKTCPVCGCKFTRESCKRVSDFREKKFCSQACYHNWCRGKNHPNYINGTSTRSDGYVRNSDKSYVHRTVMEEHIGRKLYKGEQVHHIDGDPSNNDITNLILFSSNSTHRSYEVSLQKRGSNGRFE
jgi:HNH endonuclease